MTTPRALARGLASGLVGTLAVPLALHVSARLGADRAAVNLALVCLGQEFLAAGADVIVVHDEQAMPGVSLTTLSNVARFHQAIAVSHGAERYGLAATTVVDFDRLG